MCSFPYKYLSRTDLLSWCKLEIERERAKSNPSENLARSVGRGRLAENSAKSRTGPTNFELKTPGRAN